jgi:hypothetical protein
MITEPFKNPFRPGAGQKPPYLAGRKDEVERFEKLLNQDVVFQNMILTGLRGTGKTVLLDTLKPLGLARGWVWVGTDLSEAASTSEESAAIRFLTDLAVITSQITIAKKDMIGFSDGSRATNIPLDFNLLVQYFKGQPGLVSDKLKATLELVWGYLKQIPNTKGVVFAYDEAQNMSDQPKQREYPLSLLLDVFQSLQRKEVPFLLVLVGLPTLFPKLVEARTYTERMFDVVELKSLSRTESREAITKPIQEDKCPVKFSDTLIELIIDQSGGYPYFIQFICREVYDNYLSQRVREIESPTVPVKEIVGKLDTVFFAGRWNKITDRQRELLSVVAMLDNGGHEFTIQEVVLKAKKVLKEPMSSSHMNQMFSTLMSMGLMYKTRHGKYTLGIPLLGEYIKRQNVVQSLS